MYTAFRLRVVCFVVYSAVSIDKLKECHYYIICKTSRLVIIVLLKSHNLKILSKLLSLLNLLKPTCHVMHQQFNIQQLYALPTLYFCIYLRTNSDLCHLYHKLIGFYNRNEKCLLRGTNWIFT